MNRYNQKEIAVGSVVIITNLVRYGGDPGCDIKMHRHIGQKGIVINIGAFGWYSLKAIGLENKAISDWVWDKRWIELSDY